MTGRISTDAVGLAVLKSLGSNAAIMKRKIFEQEQISRVVELDLDASSPSEIAVVMGNDQSLECRNRIAEILKDG